MSIRVMVVEDQGIVANDIGMRLKSLGYEVVALCNSGEEAIDQAAEHTPDIILMDIMLGSGIDGIEAARRIKEKQEVPLIFLTAYEDDQTLSRAKEVGPLGYILKPYDERDLRTNIEIALNKHQMESKLHKSQRRFQLLAQEIADAVVVLTAENFLWVNKAFGTLLGYKESDIAGKSPLNFIDEEEQEMFNQRTKFWLEGKDIFSHYETVFKANNGRRLNVDISAKKIDFDDQDALLMVIRDITSRKRLETDLRHLKDRLQGEVERTSEELSNAQERLIYSEKLAALGTLAMGSEFRNKMLEMRRALANIEKSVVKAELANDVQAFSDGVAYIDNIFGTFAILNDAYCLQSDVVDVDVLLRTTVEQFTFPEKIKVDTHFEEQLPFVRGDRQKLEYVILNLLTNAVSSIEGDGIIEIDAYSEDDELVIMVSDTGAGFTAQEKQHIFQPVNAVTGESLGFGLPTAAILVEGHSGRIEIDSEPGVGSKIYVMLPIMKDGVAL